jgi:signal transduction histidine kinase/DNA-binding response OmpR family regulator
VTFGGGRGFFQLPLDAVQSAAPPPPVVFTSFKVFEKEYPLDQDVSVLRSITLPASASFFSFTFAALDYLDAAKNQYSYRMEGVDPEWVFAGSRRYVSYTNLDPGRYVLRVKGSNSEGTWNEDGASIEIIIEPPWYRTAWAYGAYLLMGGSFLYLLYRFDRRRTALKHTLQMKSFEAEKMYEVDRVKSRFFANISHEFRTPLTLILGPIDQMMTRSKDEETRSTLATMRRNGLWLLQLINQLLDLSKMDAGKMLVQVRPLDLVALVRQLVTSFMPLAERKNIQLVFDPEDDQIITYLDRDKVEKIVANLLSNAFKFTASGGEVRTVLRMVNGNSRRRVEIVIADTGIGIEGEHLERIFDRFYQAGFASTSGDEGTGIGLALVKELVDLLKGSIEVQSEPGRGSTFTVHLPFGKECWGQDEIAADEVLPDLEPARSVPVPLDGMEPDGGVAGDRAPGKPALLFVEDNADVRTYIRGVLREEYNIIEAVSGNDALEKVRETEIDVVISDIMMPGMDGIELCRVLKKDDRTSHIPVVLLTARATGEGRLEGLESGADDYVTKPFDARELRSRVKNLLETRRKLRDRYGREVTLTPAQIQVTTAEEKFLKRFAENVEKHMADAGYDTETLAHDLCMSRMQLNRKLHALTGHSTHELVREFRLQRAADLLYQHADNVSGVAFEVGFNSLSHFARAFRERFGVLPSEYAARVGADQEHSPHMD